MKRFSIRKTTLSAIINCAVRKYSIIEISGHMLSQRYTSIVMTQLQDCDDDGESAAGARLLHLLQMTDACNVLVVVSRWFGGVMLGPARFTLINNAARGLLAKNGYISTDYSKTRRKGR